MWMLASALWRNRGHRSFKNFEQRLLHTFTRNIAGDRWVLTFSRDFIDLIYVDDPRLGLLDIKICRLKKLQQNVFDVFTHVTGFGQRGRIGNRKRNIQQPSQCLRHMCLATTSWPQQHDVALGEFDVASTRR